MKIKETQSTLDTDPSNYIGYEIDDKTGKRKKKDKDMKDKELHVDSPPDGPVPPVINVQAEAYKPGFVISVTDEPLDEYMLGGAHTKGKENPNEKAANPNHPLQDFNVRDRMAHTINTEKDYGRKPYGPKTVAARATATGDSFGSMLIGAGNVPSHQSPKDSKTALGVVKTFAKAQTSSYKLARKQHESEDPLKTLNHMHHLCEAYPELKMVWEDTTTGEKGYVTPSLFVKVYSKLLQDNKKEKEQPEPMSESYKSKAASMPLANELMNIGLVNNVKGTAKVLREENPMRKAMEIFYASEKSNANTDEKKSEYVPSLLKEGKMVFEKSTKPSGASTDTSSDTASKTATKTATKTSTDAYTQGNVTVTGGAGAGATSVTISIPRGDGGDPAQRAVDAKPKPTKSSKKQEEEVTPKPKRLIIW